MAGRAMSSLSLRSKINEDHLTCTICFEPFKKPKALPCLHTFCQDCLRDYVTGRGYENDGNMPCPVCRITVLIPPEGVQGFPDNYLIESLRDTVEKAKKQTPPRPALPPVSDAQGRIGNVNPAPSSAPVTGEPLYPTVPSPTTEEPTPAPPTNIPCGRGMVAQFGNYGSTIHELRKPYGLTVGKNGEYVVSDLAGSRILIFSSSGILLGRFGCECKIAGVTMTNTNHILVAVNGAGQAIMREYNFDGKLLASYGDFYKFDKPSGITITSKNHVAISNLESHNVLLFTDRHKFSKKFGWKGAGDNHFCYPQFIASNSKDNIIVSDSGNDCIKVFNSEGIFKRKFGESGSKHGYLDFPMGIAIDDQDNIIVADAGNFRVEIFTRKGQYVKTLIEDTDLIGPDVKPLNVAVSHKKIAVLFSGPQFAEIRVYKWEGI